MLGSARQEVKTKGWAHLVVLVFGEEPEEDLGSGHLPARRPWAAATWAPGVVAAEGGITKEVGGNSLCAIKKDRNALCALEKVQRSSAPLLQLFCALHATAVSLDSNAVKLRM